MEHFRQLGISKDILQALEEMGFEEPTPIQKETIPYALEGLDVIGQAQTGTGKTAAFGIPLIEKITKDKRKIQGLVIAPTRELAIQVAEEINRLGRRKQTQALPIYGGQQMGRQIRALKDNPAIVVATPGRLLDHMSRRTIQLENIETVVLDEADEMLNMGFIDDIQSILKGLPNQRQTLLFSATMPKAIREIATHMMRQPKEVKVKAKEVTVENTEQFFVEVQEKHKFDTLTNLLDVQDPTLAIVFGRTKRRVDEISEGLQIRGFKAEGIHGDLTQGKRMNVLNQFKSGRIDILVATDVAARGLDISNITHVYNFDIPQDPESYVHRIGRTGRAGKMGDAISFVTPREMPHLKMIQRVTKSHIKRIIPPTAHEAKQGQQQATVAKILEVIKQQSLSDYEAVAKKLLEEHDPVNVIAAALSLLTKKRSNRPVRLSAVQPISVKRQQSNRKSRRRHTDKSRRHRQRKRRR